MIAFNTPVERLRRAGARWRVQFRRRQRRRFDVDAVVNCAGLGAQAWRARSRIIRRTRVPRLVLGKGNYFSYAGKPAFTRLIYPVPIEGGLGVHVTLDLAGRMRFGPDVEWVERGEL